MNAQQKQAHEQKHIIVGVETKIQERMGENKNKMFNQTKKYWIGNRASWKEGIHSHTYARTRPFIRDTRICVWLRRVDKLLSNRRNVLQTYVVFVVLLWFQWIFPADIWIETENFDACWEHNVRLAHKISWPRMKSHRHRIGTIVELCRRKYNIFNAECEPTEWDPKSVFLDHKHSRTIASIRRVLARVGVVRYQYWGQSWSIYAY